MRLIDADTIFKDGVIIIPSSDTNCVNLAEYFLKKIQEAPTIEAEPIKHGRWKNNTNGTFTCSVCGKRASRGNYCPNCGAKMDEVEE